MYCIVLDWIGLDWIGLDWIGLDWIGLDCIVLYCIVQSILSKQGLKSSKNGMSMKVGYRTTVKYGSFNVQ